VLVEWNTVRLLWPEVVLVFAAASIFVAGAFTRSRAWWALVAVVAYLAAAGALAAQGPPWALAMRAMVVPISLMATS
jgi:hypothetical protein